MSKYPKRYRVEILRGPSASACGLGIAYLPHGKWMMALDVIKEIDKRDARIAELEQALADMTDLKEDYAADARLGRE